MLPTQAPLFQLISARLGWLGQRQVVAQPEPRQRRHARTIARATCARPTSPAWSQGLAGRPPASRWPGPIPLISSGAPSARIGLAAAAPATDYETTPDGNAVILEEQMAKATQTALDYQLTSNLYRKYLGMVRIALGAQP